MSVARTMRRAGRKYALRGAILLGAWTGAILPARAQIVAASGRTLFNRNIMIRSFVRIDNFSGPLLGRHARVFTNPYAVVWGAYPHLNVTFVAPLAVVQSRDALAPAQGSTHAGFGDGQILARYDLFRKNVPRGYTRLSPEFGIKVPSGGLFGTGSTDYIGGLIFSHWRDPYAIFVDAQFTRTTENSAGLRQGNRWNYDVAGLYRLLPRGLGIPALYLVLELNGESVRRARQGGVPLGNTGGDVVSISPGLQFQPVARWMLEFSAPVPVVRELNGAQPRVQSSYIAGVRWLF